MTLPVLSSADPKYSAKELTEITGIVMNVIEKHNASGSTSTATPPYGPFNDGSNGYGILSIPGVRPDVFSAFQRPRSLVSQLGVKPSLNTNEKIGILTELSDGSGTNPTGFCGTAPTAGQFKRCVQNYTFGRAYWKSQIVNVAEAGEYVDYSDTENRVLNLQQNPNPLIPNMMGRLDFSNRNSQLLANELFTMGAAMERSLETVLVQGNETTANTSTQRGFINEFRGLERQITNGKVDMNTGIACPAADSQVITWGTGIDQTVSGRTFPQLIVDTMFGLTDIANQVGLGGTRWVITMPMRMFRALTYVYSIQYWTSLGNGSAGNPSFTDATEVRRLQIDMWNNRYLLIDGNPVQVVFTEGIPEVKAGGNVYTAREMFFLPVEWQGMSMLNLQYKPMDNQQVAEFAGFFPPSEIQPINNGMWLGSKARTNFCMELLLAGKFRLIQDCPFLAARIDTIQYSFQAPYRSAYPTDTNSFVGGGASRWDGNYKVQ